MTAGFASTLEALAATLVTTDRFGNADDNATVVTETNDVSGGWLQMAA